MGHEHDICEAKLHGTWVTVGISEVLRFDPRPDLRCVECGGRLRAHKTANNGMRAHFEHRVAHRGCSRGAHFGGALARHPDAID